MARGGRRDGAGRKRKGAPVGLAKAIGQAKDLTLRLMSELDAVTTHAGELEDMIEDETARDEDGGRRRQAMLKAVSLPSRSATLKQLLAATRAWAELERGTAAKPGARAPSEGKKAAATAAAETAGHGTEWGGDLDPTLQ